MFEKEAEEWVKENMDCCKTDNSVNQSIPYFDEEERCCAKSAFKDGAEFGYNKAFVEADKNLKAVVADFNKANEWHYVKDGDLPTDTTVLYLVRVYSWDFGFSHLYKKNGTYIPTVCEWNGEYFKALDSMAYSNARNIKSCFAWKKIVLPKEIE